MSKIKHKCKMCNKIFYAYKSNHRKFCSQKCGYKYTAKLFLGNKSPRWIKKVNKKCAYCGKLFKSLPSENKVNCSIQCGNKSKGTKVSKSKKGIRTSISTEFKPMEKHRNWKGDKAKYQSLHIRIRKIRGTHNLCEVCGTKDKNKKYHWANLTGKYTDVMDYKRMCVSCHRKYDIERSFKNGRLFYGFIKRKAT